MIIGSAWRKEKDGKKYTSCVIQSPFLPGGELRFAIFPVEDKKNENSPDGVISWMPQKKDKEKTESQKAGTTTFSDENVPF